MSILDIFKSVDINKEVNRCRTTKGSVLLDVRTEGEYRQGHIGGSRNIPVEKIDNAVNLLHDKSAPIFVYCQSGSRARKASSKLPRQEMNRSIIMIIKVLHRSSGAGLFHSFHTERSGSFRQLRSQKYRSGPGRCCACCRPEKPLQADLREMQARRLFDFRFFRELMDGRQQQ